MIRYGAMRARGNTRCKSGKRSDLGDCYFRSAWEANYARVLEWKRSAGGIWRWEYEPQPPFEFYEVRRGNRWYLPDFKIWETEDDKNPYYVEVKGWMDPASKTKLRRMKKYYPDVKIMLVQKKEMSILRAQMKGFIPEWEG